MFRIRVDIVNSLNSDDLLEVCGANSYVIVRHELPHGNPHFHAYLSYDCAMKDNTLRQRFKRKFPYLKSSDYSVKKCDEDKINEYVQYLFNTKHGNKWELIDSHNFDTQLLADLQKAAKDVSDHFASSQTTKQRKGTTIWDIAQEVEKEFTENFHTINNLGDEIHKFYEQEEQKIIVYTDIAIKVLRKNKKAFDEFLLRKVITTAMSSSENGKKMMRQKMLRNFMPQ